MNCYFLKKSQERGKVLVFLPSIPSKIKIIMYFIFCFYVVEAEMLHEHMDGEFSLFYLCSNID